MEPVEQNPGARNVAKCTKGKAPLRQERAAQVILKRKNSSGSTDATTKGRFNHCRLVFNSMHLDSNTISIGVTILVLVASVFIESDMEVNFSYH